MTKNIIIVPLSLFIRFLRQYNSGAQKLVIIPIIDSLVLSILQFLKLKSSQINKREVQIRSERGGTISEN